MLNKCQQWFITLHWNLFIHSLSTVTSFLTNHPTIRCCLCQWSGTAWSYRKSSNVGIQKVTETPKQTCSKMNMSNSLYSVENQQKKKDHKTLQALVCISTYTYNLMNKYNWQLPLTYQQLCELCIKSIWNALQLVGKDTW